MNKRDVYEYPLQEWETMKGCEDCIRKLRRMAFSSTITRAIGISEGVDVSV